MHVHLLFCSILIISLDSIFGWNENFSKAYNAGNGRRSKFSSFHSTKNGKNSAHHVKSLLNKKSLKSTSIFEDINETQSDEKANVTNENQIQANNGSTGLANRNKQTFPRNNTDIETQVGGKITLRCYTGNFSDEVVTWIKRKDDQLLTIGQELYTNEDRFSASFSHQTKSWELFIKDVKLSDAGQYECQVTTHPPIIFIYTLLVKRARASIVGPKEVHIEEGSKLDIQCYVENSPSPPVYIFWYHNGTMVNYDRGRGLEVHFGNFSSNLLVKRVTPQDAGIYSCNPHLATWSTVSIHVISLETPAAMQHELNTNDCPKNFLVYSIKLIYAGLVLFPYFF